MLLEKADVEPEVYELNKQKVYTENCQGQTVCVVSFLPNIYDSNAQQRNDYISMLKKVAKANRRNPFKFFWLSAGDQLDLERDLNLGYGFPAVVAIAPHKSKIGYQRGAFNQEGVDEFLKGLLAGRVTLEDLRSDMKFKKVDKWDGEDAPVIEEVYYDDL